jgi:sucrose-6F-phosphate phosphohydrolase
MKDKLLICTDLDRTLLPNGNQPESNGARQMFHEFVSRPDVALCFVTGRDKSLVMDAIKMFELPTPDYVISDVGTNIYSVSGGNNKWSLWQTWHNEIDGYWHGKSHPELVSLFQTLSVLNLQEPHKQSAHKLSFYVSPQHLDEGLINKMKELLKSANIDAIVVSSINETSETGLIDILPKNASKLHAIKYLIAKMNYRTNNTVFAGDSGNDIDVFASDIKSICVNNATDDVKKHAESKVEKSGLKDTLYFARGGFNHFNGNYSAGILEGIAHYYPQLLK